ncbi:MiaB/RimO family radical SAM methylthiotransferase [Prosthecochloris ethylica]|uniref:MiaB/RimO family radical SAM methylthiotransferase n=1 Tax=Prosthecochloris ethylica TaxID=2743976 RepID=UPI0030844BB3
MALSKYISEKEKKRISAVTLGCKLNYAETSSILQRFVDSGWQIAAEGEEPDIVFIHTCAVTRQAEQKSRQQIRRMIRRYPRSRIVVIGCYAQLQPDVIAGIEGVDVILGSAEKYDIERYITSGPDDIETYISPVSTLDTAVPAHSLLSGPGSGRTRAFLKIQDGCDYGCAYCTIPLARGRSRSVPPDTVIDGARRLALAGYREIVLTGVNIAAYRYGSCSFAGLLRRLDDVDVLRIRVSSIEPDLLTSEVIDTVSRSTRIMPHFHLPLQGGSDAMLRAMGRRYTIATYRSRLLEAVDRIPDCAIGADIVTGYPGETDDDFRSACELIGDLPIAYLHIFTCSLRPGTALARQVDTGLRRPLPPDLVKERSRQLHELGHERKQAFARRFIGRDLQVLFEEQGREEDGSITCSGYSRNYLRVRTAVSSPGEAERIAGTEQRVRVTGLGRDLDLEAIFVT